VTAGHGAYLLTLKATRGALRRNASHCPDRRKRRVRKAWAIISGSTN
jgi:phosphoenolpyruvate carboxylase